MENKLLLWFQQGGVVMYPILLCSVVALGIFLERVFAYRMGRLVPRGLVDALFSVEKDLKAVERICSRYKTPLSRIILAGARRARFGYEEALVAMESVGQHEISVLARELRVLSTIGNIAPMLGFLGTVLGMINAFSTIAKVGTGRPELIASGISEALITTAAGLMVGIPSIIAYNFLKNKLDKVSAAMEEVAIEFLDRFTGEE